MFTIIPFYAKTKVGVVEDDAIVAMGIVQAMQEIGYETPKPAANYTQALILAGREKPDIMIIDIMLGGYKDGIDLAWTINKEFKLPFIFLTANSDAATVDRAKKAEPAAYLVKPFRKNELFASIELCLYTSAQRYKKQEEGNYIINDSIFVKQGQYFHKINIADILYIEAENVYLSVHTPDSKLLVRSSLQHYLDIIASSFFYRVHRSYVVNTRHIQKLNADSVIVNKTEIPLARAYKDELLIRLKIL